MTRYSIFALLLFATHSLLGQGSHSDTLKLVAYYDDVIAGIIRADTEKSTTTDQLFRQYSINSILQSAEKGPLGDLLEANGFKAGNKLYQKKIILDETVDTTYVDELIDLIRVKDNHFPRHLIQAYVDRIRNFETIFKIYERFRIQIKDGVTMQRHNRDQNNGRLYDNLSIVASQYQFLLDQDYCLFKNTNISKQLVKGINIYHDNDFLFIYPLSKYLNFDRDYTGGLKIEVTTDHLKMRLLSEIFEDSRFLSNSNVLSYQSIFFGVEAYTPYIRFGQEEAALRDSVYNVDRPFASFQYFGRSKFRLHYTGKWRFRNDTKIGWIGKSLAQKGQDILHRDITIASAHVEKWDEQIGGGGRLALNFDYMWDFMLYSVDGDIFEPNRQFTGDYDKFKNRSLHLYTPLELHLGNQYTGASIGLGLSNHSFKDRSGGYDFISSPQRTKEKKTQFGRWLQRSVLLSWETRLKYVQHNSMLEGIGWFKTKESDKDGLDDEFESKRKLIPYEKAVGDLLTDNYNPKSGRVNRWLVSMDFSVALRQKKTTIFLTYSFNTREFRYAETDIRNVVSFANSEIDRAKPNSKTWNKQRQENIDLKNFAQNEITYKLLNSPIRGFGRVGLNFQF